MKRRGAISLPPTALPAKRPSDTKSDTDADKLGRRAFRFCPDFTYEESILDTRQKRPVPVNSRPLYH
jgi:hypothetical protein